MNDVEWLECEVEYEILLDDICIYRSIADSEESAYQEAEDYIEIDCYGTSYTRDDYLIRIL